MPVTFNLFRLQNFPTKPKLAGDIVFNQGDPELRGHSAKTKITYNNSNDELGLEFYTSEHEMLKRVEGRLYTGEEFNEFYKRNQISILVNRRTNLIACKSSGTVAKNLIDDWNSIATTRFRADYLHFDLEGIKSRIDEVRGIWRSGVNQPNVETFAVFGTDVDQSNLYTALAELGKTASMLISQEVNGQTFQSILSAKGSVTFPQPAAEDHQIDRLLGLYDVLLRHGLIEVDSKKSAKDKRDKVKAEAKAKAARQK